MNAFKTVCAAALVIGFGAVQAQETTYTFQSQPFEDVFGTYSTGQNLTGSITLSEPLAPNITANVNSILVSYSFSDGVVTLDNTNSEIVNGIDLITDAFGGIQSYAMTFWESPLATSDGEIFTGMDVSFFPGIGSPGCIESPTCGPAFVQINSGDIRCNSVSGGQCVGGVPNPKGGNGGAIIRFAEETGFNPDFDDSIWGGGPPPQPIPALGTGSLLLLMLMLAGLAAGALRSRAV